METIRNRPQWRALGVAWFGACVGLGLSACVKQSSAPVTQADSAATRGELNWAREALQRNPRVEIVAADTDAGVFTLRDKATGEVRAVKLSELAAAPIAALGASTQVATATPATSPAAPAAEPGTEPVLTETAAPEPVAATPAAATPNYTIERTDGQVKVSGPGISIVSTGATTATPAESSPGQRSIEPLICEGRRMLHLDNRNIYVDGNAITARGGCELYITNSRISASGAAVVIDDAIVHIANSTIEGDDASFDARDGAKVFLRSSSFDGLPRRTERAVVQDQGGNQWR